VRDQLEALEELSVIDQRLAEIDREIQAIPARVKELDHDVQGLRSLLEKERNELAEAEEWDQQAEREIKIQEELLAKSRSKQAGARNERESSAAAREIETIKKSMAEKEDERLQMMEALAERRRNITKHEAEIAELQAVLDATGAEADKKAASVAGQKEQWEVQRQTMVGRLNARVLRLYEGVRRGRPNPVVEMIDETCQGCNMSLPPQIFIDVQRMERIYQCPYCKRIVFVRVKREAENNETAG
jgi:predicted  nucleic acid-binding Zn-ribbon protein